VGIGRGQLRLAVGLTGVEIHDDARIAAAPAASLVGLSLNALGRDGDAGPEEQRRGDERLLKQRARARHAGEST
jgi:hypothetical protein